MPFSINCMKISLNFHSELLEEAERCMTSLWSNSLSAGLPVEAPFVFQVLHHSLDLKWDIA